MRGVRRGVCVGLILVSGVSALADIAPRDEAPLMCGYTHSMGLLRPQEMSKRSPTRTRFELHFERGFLRPDFCEEIIKSVSIKDIYFVSCRSGTYPATITHDITVNKETGDIVTVMNFFADNGWVSKVAHVGACALGS